MSKKICVPVFLILTVCILTHSEAACQYASSGLLLWFNRMIPTLLPFMILSGTIIRMRLAEPIASLFAPVLRPIYRVSGTILYAILVGFLCGFPMGAKCTADLLEQKLITRREARFLLAFCNNIGPVYFCGYVLPLLGIRRAGVCLFGMYGVPALYGIVLRYTLYRDLNVTPGSGRSPQCPAAAPQPAAPFSLLAALDASVSSALHSIAMLGGYMVLFNLLDLVPHLLNQPLGILPDTCTVLLAPLLEISGGLNALGASHPLYSLIALAFGGLCCIAQTQSCIRKVGLNLPEYVLHKGILTAVTAAYYLIVSRI